MVLFSYFLLATWFRGSASPLVAPTQEGCVTIHARPQLSWGHGSERETLGKIDDNNDLLPSTESWDALGGGSRATVTFLVFLFPLFVVTVTYSKVTISAASTSSINMISLFLLLARLYG